ESCDHLVGDKQDLVSGTDLSHARKIIVGWNDDTSGPLYGFGYEGGYRVRILLDDGFLQRSRRGGADGFAWLCALEPVGIWRWDVHEARHARLKHFPEGLNPGRAHRGHGDAMVGMPAGNHLDLFRFAFGLPVEARRLECALVRFGPAAGEEDCIQARV